VLALAGVAAGIPLSIWASKYVSTMLFGLTPRDPLMLAFTAMPLVAVSSVTCGPGRGIGRRKAFASYK
jgi:hypothetical protein